MGNLTSKILGQCRMANNLNDNADYVICGTNATTATTTYNTMNNIKGLNLGFWNYSSSTLVEDSSTIGVTVSGTVNRCTVKLLQNRLR